MLIVLISGIIILCTFRIFMYGYVTNFSWGIVANVLYYDIIIRKFKLQSHDYILFQTNTLGKGMNLCIYRSVPPMHEYGTRPFLRWARSQGRSPHASGKAKNTFGPVGIPLFWGAEGGISLGGWPFWGRRKSPVPKHTQQNRPEVRRPTECNPRTGEERPHTNALECPWGKVWTSLSSEL